MPIDFPNNPSAGQTYSYGINRWIYNGVAWDKIDNHPGICGGNQILINYTEGFNGATFQVNVIEGKGSDLDSDLIHGVSGSRFLEHLQSGLLYGATLAVNAGNTAYFDLSAGAGIIVNFGATLSNYPNPTVSLVTWPSRTGLTAQYIATHHETWLSIDSSGNIIQQATKWSDQQYESRIPIGVLIHPNHTTINLAVDIPKLSYGNATQVDPFMRAFGPLKLSGHEISANGANLQVNKSSGTAFLLGGNYTTDPNYANVVTDTNATPISTIYHYYRDVSGEFISTISAFIDPTKYDDGSGTLATAPSGKYTTQRLFFLPGTPTVLAAYYGREIYNSIETAQANIQFESFSEDDSTASLGVFGGYLIVKANATALNNSADAKFISSGIFRNLANIGGGGVAVAGLDDLTDVVITSASNNQVLKYESGFWINSGLTSSIGNYVTTFNGLTGAVTGVTTSVANTFTALQTFNAGLSATGITLDGTLEINKRPISFSGSSVNLLNGVPGLVLQGATTGYASRIVINSNEKDGTTASIDLIPYNGNVYIRKGEYEDGGIQAAGDWKSSLYLEENQLFGGIHYGILTVPGNLSADRTLTFPNDSGTIALTKNVVSSVNGSTGAIQVVSSFNGRTGAVQGVSAALGGTGISVSGSTGSITISNTGVLSFNGLTGVVTGVTTGTANIFGPLQSFNAGLSASFVRTPSIQGPGGTDVIFDSGAIKLQQLGFPSNTTRLTASSTVDQTITLPDDTGTVALTKNVVSSFNGLTGSVTGVGSIRGLTGAVGITNESGIGLSVSGQTMTFSNTGVLSFNGLTGAVTGVTTGSANTFGPLQSFTNGISASGATFAGNLNFRNVADQNNITSKAANGIRIVDESTGSNAAISMDNLNGTMINNVYLPIKIGDTNDSFNSTLISVDDLNSHISLISYTGAVSVFADSDINLSSLNGRITVAGLLGANSGISAAGGTFSGTQTFVNGATFQGNIVAPNIVTSFNGSTGAVTGVASFNGLTGAVTGASLGANTFTGLNTFNAGISAAGGITFNSNVTINSANTLIASTIKSEVGKNQLDIANTSDSRVAIGDFDGTANSTYIFLRDATSILHISNPYGFIEIGDPNSIDTGYTISYAAAAGELNGNGSSIINFNSASINGIVSVGGLLTASAGISAAGATLSSLTTIPSGATLSVRGNITGNVVNSINGITGAVNLAAGSNITITPSGLTLTIAAGAGFSRSINVITTSTTAGATSNVDYVYIGNTSGNINLTLPTAVSNTNRYTVKNSNIGILTVLTTSSQTIDGVTGYALSKQYQAIDLLSDNSNWFVV